MRSPPLHEKIMKKLRRFKRKSSASEQPTRITNETVAEGELPGGVINVGETIVPMTLEKAIEYIKEDEYVEITPTRVRLRKKILKETERKRAR